MSARGLRTILCCAVSGAGLWGVAAGALAHHPWWVKIGAAAAAIGVALMFTGPADARDLTQADLSRIEAINQARNDQGYRTQVSKFDAPCNWYAMAKAYDLVREGYGPGEVAVAVVKTDTGALHTVAEVKGSLKGKPVTIVLDNRFNWTLARKDAEAIGYTWEAEFALGASQPAERDQ